MKKLLQSAFVCTLFAGTAFSAMAQRPVNPNEKNPNPEEDGWSEMYVNDFAIKKGEVKAIDIFMDNPHYAFNAMQFDIHVTGGLKIFEDEDGVWLDPNPDRVPGTSGRNISYVGQGAWQQDGSYRHLFYNNKGLYVADTKGVLFTLYVTTDDTFGTTDEPATISFTEVQMSDKADTQKTHFGRSMKSDSYEAVALADFLTVTDAKTRFIADPVKLIAKAPQKVNGRTLAFATDGQDNWVKLELNDEDNAKFEVGNTYDGCLLGGTKHDAINPAIAVDKTLGEYLAATAVTAVVTKVDMAHSFTLNPNEVITVTGYFFNDDNQETLRAYSGNDGNVRGQSLFVDNSWVGSNPMQNATPYEIKKAAVQLKAAWATPAAALVAPSESLSFQNYVIYPLEMAEIATGVNDINANKAVSSVRYYNVAGVEATTPFEGVNLVVTTYTDGTNSTVKVIK